MSDRTIARGTHGIRILLEQSPANGGRSLPPALALIELAIGQANLDRAAVRIDVDDVAILNQGRGPPNAASGLACPMQMPRLIKSGRKALRILLSSIALERESGP